VTECLPQPQDCRLWHRTEQRVRLTDLGQDFTISPLLRQLAAEGKRFQDMK